MTGLVVDLFAGGGGASVGLEAALGRPVDIAINHDAIALAVHKANHPGTRHLTADVWDVDPLEATGGEPVDILWASPDCTHFSVAKGGKPRKKKIRSLAWVVVKWAKAVRPAVILLENVQEFRGWGPPDREDRPIKGRMGETFRRWKAQLVRLGYQVDFRVLDASAYGAPTRRKRLFLVARCDGQTISWPEPTHGPARLPFHTAAECIDWSIPCPSIFERAKPLAPKTLWRVAQGIRRFVLESPSPFIVKFQQNSVGQSITEPLQTVMAGASRFGVVAPSVVEMNADNAPHGADEPLGTITTQHNRFNVVAPHLVKVNHGGEDARVEDLQGPLSTVTATQRGHAIVAPLLAQMSHGQESRNGEQRRGRPAHPLVEPLPTQSASNDFGVIAPTLIQTGYGEREGQAARVPEVRAFLAVYYGTDKGQALLEPLRTVTARHRLGIVTVHGVDYQIVDIGLRMLQPHELLAAQFGRFAAGYDLSAAATKSSQVRLIGNSVCPEVAEALVRANAPRAVVEAVA